MFNECLYIWTLLNCSKYNTALYNIFTKEPLGQCAVSLNYWFIWMWLWVLAYKGLKNKGKVHLVISKSRHGCLEEQSLTTAFDDNQGSYNQRSSNQDSYNQGSYNQDS